MSLQKLTPPARFRGLLEKTLPAGVVGESIIGDLDQEFREFAERKGAASARVWYRWEALKLAVRWSLGSASSERGGERGGMMKMTGLWNDVRFALRGLARAPGFTAITIGTLALGIGATSAIFSVVNGVLLKPLPFEDQDELVSVGHGPGSDRVPLNPALYFTYRDESRVFEDIGSFQNRQVSVTGLAEPEQLSAMWVTSGLLLLLRVQP